MSKRPIIFLILLVFFLFTTACAAEPTPAEPTATTVPEDTTGTTPQATEDLEDRIIITPTPQPTATPGAITEFVAEIADTIGINRVRFLGLTGEDWLNLLISVAIFLLGLFLITRLLVLLLKKVVSLTPSKFDDALLKALLFQIRFFIIIFFIEFAIQRLVFVSAEWKNLASQVYRVIMILLAVNAIWKLADLSLEWQIQKRGLDESSQQVKIVLPVLRQTVRVLLVLLGVSFVLNTFGVNITALITLLGIGGLALSLAAQDTLSDFISGMIILVDQPYRVGDRIEINQLNTWGDVVHIGARTTRIRTRDNRMVIVPNSQIGRSQIVNYTYPDPNYRIETLLTIAYGSDMALVDATIIESIRKIPGVLDDRPVDILVTELGDSGIELRVRWWINSYSDTRQIIDAVNRILYKQLDQAGISLPNITYDVNLKLSDKDAVRLGRIFRGEDQVQ
jgi:MscS family membrane protein